MVAGDKELSLSLGWSEADSHNRLRRESHRFKQNNIFQENPKLQNNKHWLLTGCFYIHVQIGREGQKHTGLGCFFS